MNHKGPGVGKPECPLRVERGHSSQLDLSVSPMEKGCGSRQRKGDRAQKELMDSSRHEPFPSSDQAQRDG